MPNRLAKEKSPYLLQHANNPVDWYPWSDEAFDKAKNEDKPVFLSIGYSTCHWCHVRKWRQTSVLSEKITLQQLTVPLIFCKKTYIKEKAPHQNRLF